MQHQPDVGAIDAHAKGVGGDDNGQMVAHKGVLYPVADVRVKTGVIGLGAEHDGPAASFVVEGGERLGQRVVGASWSSGEISASPGGLPLRWLIKAALLAVFDKPGPVAEVIHRAMAKRIEDRFADAAEFLAALAMEILDIMEGNKFSHPSISRPLRFSRAEIAAASAERISARFSTGGGVVALRIASRTCRWNPSEREDSRIGWPRSQPDPQDRPTPPGWPG